MITRDEFIFLNEIFKGLNLITVNGQNTVTLGKCIESLEKFLEIKQEEILQQENMIAQKQLINTNVVNSDEEG